MNEEKIIRNAEFNPSVSAYWLLSGVIISIVTIIGIPFLIFWLPFGLFFTKRHLKSHECVLTEKALKVKKGFMIKIEKTIPLEKITDMGMVEGPIMRAMDLQKLTVETAGQSGPGSLVALTGIIDAKGFREAVLAQRDAVAGSAREGSPKSSLLDCADAGTALVDINNTLLRIEEALNKRDGSQ